MSAHERRARRIAISVIGGSVLVVGAAMVVLPGPALIVIPLGLAILGPEFAWARRWLRAARVRAQQHGQSFTLRRSPAGLQ